MNKTNVILEKAVLFEKLSRCKSKQAMLKVLASDTLDSLISEINQEIARVTTLKLINKDIPYLPDEASIEDVIFTANEVLYASLNNKNYDNKDYLKTLVERAKTLASNVVKEPRTISLETPTTSYDVPDNNPKNIIQPVSGTPEMNKYFMMVVNGEKLLNTLGMLDVRLDHKKIYEYKPQFEKLIVDLNTFKQYMRQAISRPGEARTLSARVDNLLGKIDVMEPKMLEASTIEMSKGNYA